MTSPDPESAHRHCLRNRPELLRSTSCACFCCLAAYPPSEIAAWIPDEDTALCPRCGADAVLGDAAGLPLTPGFLEAMRSRWFGQTPEARAAEQRNRLARLGPGSSPKAVPAGSFPWKACVAFLLVAVAGGAAAYRLRQPGGSAAPEELKGQEILLDYVPEGFPLGMSTEQGFALHLFEQPTDEFKRLPPAGDAARYYDTLEIAGRSFLVITEASDPPQIWLDANGNGDMTDDPGPFPAEREGGVVPNFYALELPAREGGDSFPYRLWIFPSNQGGTRFYAGCHMAGELLLGEKAYPMVLFDGNANGDYADDPVAVDIDGDGKIQDEELLRVGGTLDVGGVPVTLESVSASGRAVRMSY